MDDRIISGQSTSPSDSQPPGSSPAQPGPQQEPPVPGAAEPDDLPSMLLNGVSDFIDLGGPVVAMLLVLSVFALAIILVKLWQLLFAAGTPTKRISAASELWVDGEYERAIEAMQNLKGPVVRVIDYVMRGSAAKRDSGPLREEAEQFALSELASLRSCLRGLEAVVQVAPLLGLFGTVLGMIEAFRALESAGTQVNPANLAGGIWVALLTTAVGLAIAMPVSLVLHWFEGRIERIRRRMEFFTTEVLTNPPSRALKGKASLRKPPRLAQAAE